jgi:hypothetical protein
MLLGARWTSCDGLALQPNQFQSEVAALAHTLSMPVGAVIASLDALIKRGHLQRITGNTNRLRPPAR